MIWQNRVCVTTALSGKADAELKVGLYGDIKPVEDDTEHEWRVMCLDKKSGKVAWTQTAHKGVPKIKRHTKATHANSDARHRRRAPRRVLRLRRALHAIASRTESCSGRRASACSTPASSASAEAQWGFASSPVIHDGKIIIQADVQKDSFIAAFDIKDGKEVWRTAREDVPTWSTPGIVQEGARTQLIANGWHEIAGYDFATGKKLWTMKGGGDIPVPTPIAAHGLIFITNAHGGLAPIYAIKPDATGDITLASDATSNQHIAWSAPRDGNYMQTPIVYGPHLYASRDNGVLRVYDAGHRQSPLRAAHGRRQDGLHRVAGRGGRQDLLHE